MLEPVDAAVTAAAPPAVLAPQLTAIKQEEPAADAISATSEPAGGAAPAVCPTAACSAVPRPSLFASAADSDDEDCAILLPPDQPLLDQAASDATTTQTSTKRKAAGRPKAAGKAASDATTQPKAAADKKAAGKKGAKKVEGVAEEE